MIYYLLIRGLRIDFDDAGIIGTGTRNESD